MTARRHAENAEKNVGAQRAVPFLCFARLLLLSAALASGREAASSPLTITHISIVDTKTGTLLADRTVAIEEGRIIRIEKAAGAGPKNGPILDGHGKYLLPGLWDMHVHLSAAKASALPALVANGVTGVRDMGGRLEEIDEWRTKIASSLLVGPYIVRAGPILNGRKFNSLQMVTGNPDETRGVVRALKEVGVDFLKVHRRMPKDSYLALLEEAKRLGLTVAGHIPMTVTPEEASDAGQASLEHAETLFEGTFSAGLKEGELPDAIRRFRDGAAEKLFSRFVASNTRVTPTLVAYRSIIESGDPSVPLDPRARYVARSLREEAQKTRRALPEEELRNLKRTFAELREVVRQMNQSGVALLAGSDLALTRLPGFSLHEELALLVEAGLTPAQALQAATLAPAGFLGRSKDFGTVETGKFADLVLLEANPLDDVRNTQRIWAVVLRGKLLRHSDLDGLLREAERMADKN